ncbi:Nba1p LALA0_S02e09692g [Lachancea lanzarotensis]|uniref:LALA0S02e09692g1_1 n=1 Tax=Lachancea lanzarotensis TaxID=1245769 RepID=A0A0C7MUM4_9SACH|nr:uncharacterized protein LALA0_S02e09692g [Lachancea lanzarotensis]CEP61231.1 LALA0S02e09692g1_1 [Lachancea lanzarotensis]
MTMNTNSKRLSAMIDSLHTDKDDDLFYVQKTTSANTGNSGTSSLDSLPKPPAAHSNVASERGLTSPNFKFGSPGNRESLISDYSASIHEGVPVYLNQKTYNTRDDRPVIYSAVNFPLSEETVAQNEEIPYQQEKKSPNDLEGLRAPSPNVNVARDHGPKGNTTLKLSATQHFHHKKNSTVGSGNMASESGHSHNISDAHSSLKFVNQEQLSPANRNIESEQIQVGETLRNNETLPLESKTDDVHKSQSPARSSTIKSIPSSVRDASDTQSLVSSIVPSLRTHLPTERTQAMLPDRSQSSDYNPSIPPRSRNRPKSHLFIKNGLDDIQSQLQEQMALDHSRSTSRTSTNKSSSYFSAIDPASRFNMDDYEDGDEDQFGKPDDDDSYLHRPLPTVPANHQKGSIDRNETILISPAPESNPQPPRMPSFPPSLPISRDSESILNTKKDLLEQDPPTIDGNDDDYEDIPDENSTESGVPPITTTGKASKNRRSAPDGPRPKSHGNRREKRKSRDGKREVRSFDIDTIAQMLDVTKGTMIGSEFADLGMQTEEKRALERLVDSLSRLTADMVIDPRRFREGMKRLDKATRALEGF